MNHRLRVHLRDHTLCSIGPVLRCVRRELRRDSDPSIPRHLLPFVIHLFELLCRRLVHVVGYVRRVPRSLRLVDRIDGGLRRGGFCFLAWFRCRVRGLLAGHGDHEHGSDEDKPYVPYPFHFYHLLVVLGRSRTPPASALLLSPHLNTNPVVPQMPEIVVSPCAACTVPRFLIISGYTALPVPVITRSCDFSHHLGLLGDSGGSVRSRARNRRCLHVADSQLLAYGFGL